MSDGFRSFFSLLFSTTVALQWTGSPQELGECLDPAWRHIITFLRFHKILFDWNFYNVTASPVEIYSIKSSTFVVVMWGFMSFICLNLMRLKSFPCQPRNKSFEN
jgi:hypothetical protein